MTEITKIILHPMAAPRPALKYRLLPPFGELKPGNAAVFYNKVPAEIGKQFNDGEMWERIEALREMPLAEVRKDKVCGQFISFFIKRIIRGAHCEYCDWQLPVREQEYWTIDLSEIQQTRAYGRILAAKARLQMADGHYDEALLTLQAGYALARHVATGPTMVQCLVGLSIAGMISEQVRELIQQPDAPNLYWAISFLPKPFIDMRPALEVELDSVYLSYPELRDLEKMDYSPEQWRQLFEQTYRKCSRWMWTEVIKAR